MYSNLNNNHQLIAREQNYLLDRKLLSVHSEDRDIKKWPYSNEFEIIIPDNINNIQSMRLVESTFPANFYVFSICNQNTKFQFTDASGSYTVDIREGFYCPNDLANEIKNKMNRITALPTADYKVIYDSVGQKYYFGNSNYNFSLNFDSNYPDGVVGTAINLLNVIDGNNLLLGDKSGNIFIGMKLTTDTIISSDNIYVTSVSDDQVTLSENVTIPNNTFLRFTALPDSDNGGNPVYYDLSGCCVPNNQQKIYNVYNQYNNWGLGYNLGFEKKTYVGNQISDTYYFDYLSRSTNWLPANSYIIEAPLTMKILGEQVIYMEVDKYNSYLELYPYSESTSSTYNNDSGGNVKSAFAKIPVTALPNGQFFDSRNGFYQNLVYYDPPLERIQKLKFKFRYHDGRLVDFQNSPFNFTIEFNTLQNEIKKSFNVNIPPTYNL